MAPLRSVLPHSPPAFRPGSVTTLQAAVALVVSLLAGVALVASPDWWVAFGLLGVAALIAFGLTYPAAFLILFLVVRPLLDDYSDSTIGVPSANIAGALGAFVIAIAAVVLALRHRRFSVPGAIPLTAVTAMSVLAAVQGEFELGGALGTRSISELVRLGALIAVFLLAAQVTTSVSKARALFVVVALSALIPAAFGISELLSGIQAREGEDVARISGTFTGPVSLGAFLAFGALLTLFGPMQKVPGWLRWPGLALMLFALLESYSRLGWVIFVVGLFILAWPRQKRLVVIALIGFAVALTASADVRHRALPVSGNEQSDRASGGGYESYDWRVKNWSTLLEKASERPLLGHGLKSTEFVNPRATLNGAGVPGGGYGAHNMIVRVLVEGGVVLLVVYLAFFGAIMRRMWRLSRQAWPLADQARLLLVIWGLVLFTGASTDDPMNITALMLSLLAVTGALEGAWHARGREQRQTDQPEAAPAKTPAPFWRPAAPGGVHGG